MRPRTRRERLLLRLRRRYGGTDSFGRVGNQPAIIGPITGYELYLWHRYGG